MSETQSNLKPGVLFVDDEAMVLRTVERVFRDENVRTYTATNLETAREILQREFIQVVVTDHQMPGGDGVSLLEELRHNHPDKMRIMLTGYRDINIAVRAINDCEVFRLMTKPWNDQELRLTVRQALDTYAMHRELDRLNRVSERQRRRLEELNTELEAKVEEQTREVRAKHLELRTAYVETVRALAEAVDAKDSYTRGHSERVGIYSTRIARELGCSRKFIERIYLAGLLHDIGKIGVPDAVISKPGKLTREEEALMQRHPDIGARILEPVSFLRDVVPCVRHHHEWYDGSQRGYPDRLRGSEIPFPSRIILVADTVEAMTSDRPYRKALALDVAIEEIERFSGSQFDPEVAGAFLALIEREGEDFIERASKFQIEEFLGDCQA